MHLANILLKILVSMLICNIELQFSFFVGSLSGFGIRMMLASQKECESLPSSWIFLGGEIFEGLELALLKYFVKFSCETLWSKALVCWSFLITCFDFVSCYWSVQAFCYFTEFWKIIFFQKFAHFIQVFTFLGIWFVIPYKPLYFCGLSCNFSSFISDCVYLSPLSFFLVSLIKGLSILSLQRTSSWIS